jgi:hypothetical protein
MVLTQPILHTLHDMPVLAAVALAAVALAAVALVVCRAPSIMLAPAVRRRSRAMLVINLLRDSTLVGWLASLAMVLDRMRSWRRKTRRS